MLNRTHKYQITLLFRVIFHPLEMYGNPKTNSKEMCFFNHPVLPFYKFAFD